ncbi:hypothetical protein BCR33DRAFT_711588 [Rhizoclosmatium globosum]|uniref:Uncharacterized protein n=1 Tax=Rhizoclosmatium globosum TaxID=329046 RepID=A0A1Y2D1U9_9FUNG|nr:hypothetical protein BCR33DRAFT_711588 [Rhizoclosmatium globosum]|eukprot:ORY53259.1 hypothetical protein BCR33DRAFT_711588 [Rhizoclosmatium globosum]
MTLTPFSPTVQASANTDILHPPSGPRGAKRSLSTAELGSDNEENTEIEIENHTHDTTLATLDTDTDTDTKHTKHRSAKPFRTEESGPLRLDGCAPSRCTPLRLTASPSSQDPALDPPVASASSLPIETNADDVSEGLDVSVNHEADLSVSNVVDEIEDDNEGIEPELDALEYAVYQEDEITAENEESDDSVSEKKPLFHELPLPLLHPIPDECGPIMNPLDVQQNRPKKSVTIQTPPPSSRTISPNIMTNPPLERTQPSRSQTPTRNHVSPNAVQQQLFNFEQHQTQPIPDTVDSPYELHRRASVGGFVMEISRRDLFGHTLPTTHRPISPSTIHTRIHGAQSPLFGRTSVVFGAEQGRLSRSVTPLPISRIAELGGRRRSSFMTVEGFGEMLSNEDERL